MLLKSFLIVALICYVNSSKLPPFLKACENHDNKCALEVANKAIADLVDGYKPFKMRSLNPFKFDRFDLSTGSSLQLFLINGEVHNLTSIVITDIDADTDTKEWSIKGTLNAVVDSEYDVSGKILILPVQGTGKSHIELSNTNVDFSGNLKVVNKNGEDYYKLEKDEIKMKIGSLKMKFENLFNGDKILGDQLNLFINENWQDVELEFHNGIIGLIRTIVLETVNPIFDNVPISELIL